MKNGICPKCGAAAVYVNAENGVTYNASGSGPLLRLAGLFASYQPETTSYVCAGCGYFENYIAEAKALSQIAANAQWNRVAPRG